MILNIKTEKMIRSSPAIAETIISRPLFMASGLPPEIRMVNAPQTIRRNPIPPASPKPMVKMYFLKREEMFVGKHPIAVQAPGLSLYSPSPFTQFLQALYSSNLFLEAPVTILTSLGIRGFKGSEVLGLLLSTA